MVLWANDVIKSLWYRFGFPQLLAMFILKNESKNQTTRKPNQNSNHGNLSDPQNESTACLQKWNSYLSNTEEIFLVTKRTNGIHTGSPVYLFLEPNPSNVRLWIDTNHLGAIGYRLQNRGGGVTPSGEWKRTERKRATFPDRSISGWEKSNRVKTSHSPM